MRYYMFIDESGDANVKKPDPRFDIFVLCGVVFREDHYAHFNRELKELKTEFFGNEDTIFHSVEMRTKKGVFELFLQQEVLSRFYERIGAIFTHSCYNIISCVVNKEKYRTVYPYRNYAYEEALTFLCERGLHLMGEGNREHILHLCLEKRGNPKDAQILKHFDSFIKYGTEYKSTYDFQMCHPELHFRGKDENTNGLQFSDLIAYPIARKFLTPNSPQPTFDIFEHKLYRGNPYTNSYVGWGIKHFPSKKW